MLQLFVSDHPQLLWSSYSLELELFYAGKKKVCFFFFKEWPKICCSLIFQTNQPTFAYSELFETSLLIKWKSILKVAMEHGLSWRAGSDGRAFISESYRTCSLKALKSQPVKEITQNVLIIITIGFLLWFLCKRVTLEKSFSKTSFLPVLRLLVFLLWDLEYKKIRYLEKEKKNQNPFILWRTRPDEIKS